MLQFAEAHMQVRAARNQVGWFKKQEQRVEGDNLKLLILISSIKTARSRSVLAERSQEVQQFQRPGIDHARMTSSAGAQGVLRQAQTGSPAQSRKMFPRATFLSRRITRCWSREP